MLYNFLFTFFRTLLFHLFHEQCKFSYGTLIAWLPNPSSTMNATSQALENALQREPLARHGLPMVFAVLIIIVSAYSLISRSSTHLVEKLYPVVNERKEEYLANGWAMIQRGKARHGESPFRVYTGMGSVLILPPKYATEIKNDKRFDASKFLLQVRKITPSPIIGTMAA